MCGGGGGEGRGHGGVANSDRVLIHLKLFADLQTVQRKERTSSVISKRKKKEKMHSLFVFHCA